MVNTKRASLLKKAIASSASCWREPFFLKNSRGNIRIRSLANGKRVRRPERAPGPGLKPQDNNASFEGISEAEYNKRHMKALKDADPGLKRQASSVKLSNQPEQASSDKRQAPGSKLQASSHKRQAP